MDLQGIASGAAGGAVALIGSLVVDWYRGRTAARYSLAHARWELRRDTYVNLLTLLERAHAEITSMLHTHELWKAETEAAGKAALLADNAIHTKRTLGLIDDLAVQRRIAHLWLSDESLGSLAEVIKHLTSSEVPDGDYWPLLQDTIRRTAREISRQGRDDLRINLPEPVL